MNRKIYNEYVTILESELVPALGCTEPIALAYATAKAKEVLGKMPDHITMRCSGNIIKNVKGVKVPNSGGMKGVEAAAVLGITGGDPSQALEVLEHVTDREIDEAEKLLKAGFCDCVLKDDVANLYIEAYAVCKKTEKSEALVVIEDEHTNITHIEKDGQVLFHKEKKEYCQEREKTPDKSLLNLEDIITFANEVQITDVEKVLGRQIKYNTRIAEEGLRNPWGAQVGRVVLEEFGEDVKWRAVAKASAGSDARMSGCALPVIINSGSGNQGMTCSLPVIEFGKELKKSKEEIYRALCVSNLVALNQKKYIGSLSAYCGAVCAAAGAGAGITYLCGGTLEQIENTVVNTIADAGGIVCDGAKPSCAAKISTALQAAILSHKMAMRGLTFARGEGLVMDCPEDTIKAVGYVGRAGMKQTDVEILNLMIGKTKLEDIDK
ncbi:L-cysteine desulfidase family protein [[Ruminococcus] torques]|uniref:L-cysteine desulfidase family protein n=2 Tax=[Ruminococcus] torques TaxID=33039 RepID=UPI002665F98F|nr:L-serine ammonia-lyase, iron-sulfur-dependent, subunit alpha [[Ruminococcus] torques]